MLHFSADGNILYLTARNTNVSKVFKVRTTLADPSISTHTMYTDSAVAEFHL